MVIKALVIPVTDRFADSTLTCRMPLKINIYARNVERERKLRMSNNLLIGDLFCGAGGTSTGVVRAVRELGREVTLICVNHWPVAIETHKRNHPEARHYLQDINTADPVKIVPEGYLDLLCASPECTGFSRARGGKPTNDQQRMPPFRILDWLTKLDVCCLLIENVSEFISWGPLLEDGRPDPTKKGMYFQSWFNSIRDLGYKPEWRYLNAADFGDATTRTRFFLIARKDGKPVRWPHPTHTKTGDKDMFEHLPEWRAAREIINWDNPGRSLLDDPRYLKKPLSEKTLKRIARMLENLELARAMGFTDNESTYEFCGNKSEVTKQIGNAVPVNLAKALVKSILES
jgi:DNA (cytosine-5)-methyltransferase 1